MQKTQIITLNLSNNFNIFEHTAELKCQGFMLLSYLLEHKESLNLKTKILASKLKIHVSTLRRWMKKLKRLGFVKLLSSQIAKRSRAAESANSQGPRELPKKHILVDPALSADPPSGDLSAIRDDKQQVIPTDPLEDMLDNLCFLSGATLTSIMQDKGVEIDVNDKPKLKQIMLSDPSNMETLMGFYEMLMTTKRKSAENMAARSA